MAIKRKRIGILGGTFNPIHVGHLLIAQDALEQGELDCVRFIPTALPPHKHADHLATAAQRLAMVRLAIRGDDRFALDDLEIKRGGKSYSVDTLTELRRREPEAQFYFIIGGDSLAELHTWKNVARLVELCSFIVVTRPGFKSVANMKLGAAVRRKLRLQFVAGHLCEVASRDIRSRVARGQSVRYLVPENVFRYIQLRKLYR